MRLLFITNSRIGDAVLSTGLLDHLIRRHPDVSVTVACGPVAAPLFTAVPGLERVHALRKRPRAGHWRALWAACAGQRWDLVVDLRGSPVPWLLRAGRRLRPTVDGRAPLHRVRRIGSALGPAGLADPPAPRLWTTPEDDAAAAAAWARAGITDAEPVLALAPTANWIGKTWPADRFVALARRLTAPGGALPGARVAVFGAAGERDAAAPVLDALAGPGLIDLVGGLSLLAVAAALRRCALFVGNDSGLMHMAAASGVRTVGLFGPSRDEHYAPWGPRGRVVRTPEPYATLFPPDLDPTRVGSLMGSLTVDTVVAAIAAPWDATAP
ncbi:glycosyltransferase family 9 protein [Roseospira visakhapatnamensis]|uniref:ADP-heptose:LPS heptosyltransferase n=1 Tax=Roseospira visakhapatnamensis TaxID=390880 RepID=A0A7W6RCF7_9PROT|nr:glycosyltransferase family 9 protein [Roseospira visakhapatnamensis]MBB4265931.1 ADP-heptose:LPS heptosyltransferase [Roseospira visakhapatnamensis]